MRTEWDFVAGLPHLDVHTLSEDWALAASLEVHWKILADSMGLRPASWIDSGGDRMYGAVIWLQTSFDLDDTIKEDDTVQAVTSFDAVRKPHALSTTMFAVDDKTKATVRLLTSFIKRTERGSNKKFSKVRDIWTEKDFEPALIDEILSLHHETKSVEDAGATVCSYEINRIQDFNTADFMYFKNFVRIAKAAEWVHDRGGPTLMSAHRDCFFFGNVDDGTEIETRISDAAGQANRLTAHYDGERRIFLARSQMKEVKIAER